MKISAIILMVFTSTATAHADYSNSSFWVKGAGGNTQVNSNNDSQTMYESGYEDDLLDDDSEDDAINSDSYVVDEPKIHIGKLVLTNIWEIDISSTLYVYGDMEVTNVEDFVVSGKLRVTGKLIVTNASLELKGGTLYVGKKKFINGSLKWKARKIHSSLVKIDQYLQTEISQEQLDEIISTVKAADMEYKTLSKELLAVKKQKGDVLGVGEKLVQNRQDLFAELEQYIQEEDLAAFGKLEVKEIAVAKRYYKKVTGKKDI